MWFTPILPVLFLLSAIMVGFPMVIMESMIASISFGRDPEMDLLGPLSNTTRWLIGLYMAVKLGDLFVRRAPARLHERPRSDRGADRRAERRRPRAVRPAFGRRGAPLRRVVVLLLHARDLRRDHQPHERVPRRLPAAVPAEGLLPVGRRDRHDDRHRLQHHVRLPFLRHLLPGAAGVPRGGGRDRAARDRGQAGAQLALQRRRGSAAALVRDRLHPRAPRRDPRGAPHLPPGPGGDDRPGRASGRRLLHARRPPQRLPQPLHARPSVPQRPGQRLRAGALFPPVARREHRRRLLGLPPPRRHGRGRPRRAGPAGPCTSRSTSASAERAAPATRASGTTTFSRCDQCHRYANEADDPSRIGLKGALHRQCIGCHEQHPETPVCPPTASPAIIPNVPDHRELVALPSPRPRRRHGRASV